MDEHWIVELTAMSKANGRLKRKPSKTLSGWLSIALHVRSRFTNW